MIASVFVYAIVVEVLERSGGRTASPAAEGDVLRYVLFGIAAVLFFVVRAVGSMDPFRIGPPAAGAGPAGRGGAAALAPRLLARTIVQYALCEVPAVLGLVAYFLNGIRGDFYLLMLLSLFLFAVHFPKYGRWEELAGRRR